MSTPASVFNKLYDPLWLFGDCTVTAGSGSAPNTAALMNPHGLPMELLAVHWRIYPINTPTEVFTTLTGMGIAAKMDLGSIPVVDAEVPLTAFGTTRDIADRAAPDQVYVDPQVNLDLISNAFSYKWRLKFPLHIPAGCVLSPTYSHLGQNQNSVKVETLYVCRSLPPDYVAPKEFPVPWVGSYNSISFDNIASQLSAQDFSSEVDIVNPFKQTLELSRLAGSCSGVFNGTDSTPSFNAEVESYFRYQLGKVRIRSRSGDEIVRSPTPFNGLFPYGWRAWDVPGGWQLRPTEFYKVQLNVAATSATPPAELFQGSVQFSIAATGFRRLPKEVFLAAAEGEPT